MAEPYNEEQLEVELRGRRNARLNIREEERRQSLALEQIADELYQIRRLLVARDGKLR